MLTFIAFGAIIVVPILLLFFLRSNAAVVFLSLCAGTVLLKYVGDDAYLVVSSVVTNGSVVVSEAVNIALVVLPALVATIMLRKSVAGPKVVLNLLPAILVGLLVALSVVPLISVVSRSNITNTQVWTTLAQFQGLIVAVGVVMSLILLKGSGKKHGDKHGKGHK